MTEAASLNVLFVCSRNQWRSPTAERLFRKMSGVNVRSAGTSRAARRTVKQTDIDWADLILVMEPEHALRLKKDYRQALRPGTVHVLDIPDDYQFMDPELVELIIEAAKPLILSAQGSASSA